MDLETKFLECCKKGMLENVCKMLDENPGLLECKSEGPLHTPLHCAARRGHYATVLFLLDRGANIHAKTVHWETPLHMAALDDWSSVCRLLLERKAFVDPQLDSGQRDTPLRWALNWDNMATIFLLMANGASLTKAGVNSASTNSYKVTELAETLNACRQTCIALIGLRKYRRALTSQPREIIALIAKMTFGLCCEREKTRFMNN